jgi:hypothetical protein
VDTEETTPTPPEGATLALVPDAAGQQPFALNDPAALAERLRVYGESRALLVDWLLSKLVAGIDYTLIHRKVGTRGNKVECPNVGNLVARSCQECGGKSSLCKPGSEKICGLLQLRPVFSRDVEMWEMLGSEPGVIALKCELVTSTGVVVAEGRGARHRDMDYGDLNKSVKMTQKSAQTDAVLRCAGLSEIFTQDLEDLPGFRDNGDDAADFQTPEAPAAPAPVRAPSLRDQLGESVRRAVAVPAGTPVRERASMIRGSQGQTPPPVHRPPVRGPQAPAPRAAAGSSTGNTPPDALSPARINRLFALLHEAVRGADVPEEQHEGVFNVARRYLTDWVGQTQGRESIGDCSWRAYDELCAQVPAAVDAALGQEPPPEPRYPRPRIVRRSYGAPKPFLRRGY